MGLRFRRTLTLLSGVRVNLGLHGASVSVGPRGASLTMGRHGIYANVGLRGTCLSYRTRLAVPARRGAGTPAPTRRSARPPAPTPRVGRPPQPVAPVPPLSELTLRLRDDGGCEVRFADGRVPDARQAKVIWGAYESVWRQQLSDEARRNNAPLDAIADVHTDTPGCDCIPVYSPQPSAAEPPRAPADVLLEAAPQAPPEPELGLFAALSPRARSEHAQTPEQQRRDHAEALLQWQERRNAASQAYAQAMRRHRVAMDAWEKSAHCPCWRDLLCVGA